MKTENYLGDGVVVEWWCGEAENCFTRAKRTLNYDSASNYKCMFGPPVWSASLVPC